MKKLLQFAILAILATPAICFPQATGNMTSQGFRVDTNGRTQVVGANDPTAGAIAMQGGGDTPLELVAHSLFDDTFPGATINTTNWNAGTNAGGGVAAAVASNSGQITLGSGTTANGYSYITTVPNFNQAAPGHLLDLDAINLENPVTTNAYRAWGYCTPQSVPTATAPIVDGLVFEITTAGKLQIAGWANGGGRTLIKDLSSAGTNQQPTDTAVHKYFIKYRGDQAFFYIDAIQAAQATAAPSTAAAPSGLVATMGTGAPGPINNTLPKCLMAVANSVAPSSSAVVSDNAVWVGDTTGTNIQISDGTFPFRKTTVTASGSLQVNTEGTKTTYRAASNWTPTATAATDVFTITGSATKTVRVNHVGISCTATAAIASDVLILTRSTANTAGTSAAVTAVRLDPNDAAATATVLTYTANPTTGTLVGSISDDKASITATTGAPQFYFEDFTIRNGRAVVLRGIASVLAINLNAASIAGLACAAEVEWTEE